MSDLREFFVAVMIGRLEEVKRRFRKEYVNVTDEHEWTALHCACGNNNDGSGDIVRYLVSEGWKIEAATDTYQFKPIHCAAYYGNISAVTALIEARCILDCRTKDGRTPINVTMNYGVKNWDECARLLRSAMAPTIEIQMKRAIASLNGKKEILLGQGAFGRVIRCNDDYVGYNFAVKKMTFIDKEVKGLINEISIYNKMEEHDRIVKYYGTHRDEDAIYIFTECMEGGSIADYLDKHGVLNPDKIAHYTKQVLHGLDFLHRHNIIHRDIKGANILRDTKDDIKLCDFSISRYLQNMTTQNTMEKAKTECGTAYWMAPEVIRGEEYRFSADIWSLGATVVEMSTGTHPYPRLNSYQAIFRIGNTRKLEYDTPESMTPILQSFIDQMLVPDQMERAKIDALLASDFIRDAS